MKLNKATMISCAAFLLHGLFVFSQQFGSLDFRSNYEVRCIYYDASDQLLYAGGNFDYLKDPTGQKTINTKKIAVYDGVKWDSVDNSHSHKTYVQKIKKLKGDLYVMGTGGVHVLEQDTLRKLKIGGAVDDAIVYKDTIYFMGGFKKAGGKTMHGITKWDGQNFYPLAHLNQFGSFYYYFTAAVFKGELYVGGNFSDTIDPKRRDIMRFDGKNWKPLGNGIGGDPWVNDMVVYKDDLYVGGNFHTGGGNVSNNIMRWDGNQWKDVDGGLGLAERQVSDLEVFSGKLYVGGWFQQTTKGMPASRIAVWDGTEWCSYSHTFNNGIIAVIESYNGKLIVSGNNIVSSGENIITIEDPLDIQHCSTQVDSPEIDSVTTEEISLYPNPTSDVVHINQPKENILRIDIWDVTGKLMNSFKYRFATAEINLSGYPSGVYFIKIATRQKTKAFKVFKE